jgi:dihydrolipoamide dehydrogenase
MSEMQFDVVFIGAGPGGYVGAIRAAQLGLKTAIIEKDKTFGGTCLNVGCIPSKALLESSEHYANAKHDLVKHGVEVEGLKLNLGTLLERKEKIVKDLTQGIAFLMKKNKITTFNGVGKVIGANQVEVTMANGVKPVLTTKNIVLATGSAPIELPFLKFDEQRVVSSTGALSLATVPKRMVIIGAGVIGLEMGSVWSRLGAEVTFIEFADKIGGAMDGSTMTMFQKILQKQGFKFLLKTKVVGADISDKEITVKYESASESSTQISADVVLVAVGRRPYTQGLGLQELGIELDKGGRVIVNEHLQTGKHANIYAIGDIIQGPMLAHKAEEEGVAVAELIAGQAGHVNYNTVPGVIYTWPEVASVGMTEEQLKEKNIPYKAGTFPFMANGRAKALGFTEGQAKVLAHQDTDKILGVHIVGPRASELIGEAVVAMEFGGSAEDLARSFHAHPTLSEVIREAALNVDKRARQM